MRGRPGRGRLSSRSVRSSFRPGLHRAGKSASCLRSTSFENIPGAAFDNTLDPVLGLDPDFRVPAEPSIAVGLNRIVEIVNNTVIILDKRGIISQTNIWSAFQNVPPNSPDLGHQVVYDDTNGRFYITYVTVGPGGVGGLFTIHNDVSIDSTPNDYTNSFVLAGNGAAVIPQTSATTGVPIIPINAQIGYNREGAFFTYDLVTTAASATAPAGAYDSTLLLVVDKATNTNTAYQMNNLNYGMSPAQMHNAPAGVADDFHRHQRHRRQRHPVRQLVASRHVHDQRVQRQRALRAISVGVPNYNNGKLPDAPQPGDFLDTFDTAITNAAWRNNTLVASQTAKVNGKDMVRWYQITTANNGATLDQSGNIDGGPGIWTFFPRIDISARGDLGIVYNESSATESFHLRHRPDARRSEGLPAEPAPRKGRQRHLHRH